MSVGQSEGLLMTGVDKKLFNPTLYNLRWEEYHKIVLDNFWTLLNQETLVDCTLACSPLDSLPVHRLVLSANSPYFRSLLEAHSTHPHPIIILHDVKIHILKMIVTFIYRGSVTVSSEEMPLLLKTAESLQILGLSQTIQARHVIQQPIVQPIVVQQTPTPVYSKKARILEQQSNLYINNNNTQHLIPEQLSPLALRKEQPPSSTRSMISLSAPTTPGQHYHPQEYSRHDYQDHYASHLNSPADVNHCEDNEVENNDIEEEEEDSRGIDNEADLNHDNNEEDIIRRQHEEEEMQTTTAESSQVAATSQHLLRYSCPYCSSCQFPSQSTLSRHIMLLHPSVYTALYNEKEEEAKAPPPTVPGPPGQTSASSIVCKFCGKPFTEVSQLIQHLPIHTGERPFKCEFCGKAFKLRHHMKDHARVHTGERPFRCSLCGKTFSRSTILKAHEKTHFPKNSNPEAVSPNSNFKL